jgi:phage shock protein C
MKRLYRSSENKILAGVFGGIGEYFEVDPTLLRLISLVIIVFTGIVPGVIIYILAAFIVPIHRKKAEPVEPSHHAPSHS